MSHAGETQPQLIIVGTKGVAFLDENLQQTKLIRLQAYAPKYVPHRVALVHMRLDAGPSFLAREAIHVVLFDQTGAPRWTYTNYLGINDATVGDVNGDGECEVVIGLNGFAGLRLLNAEGRKLWGKYGDGNIWQVGIVPRSGSNSGRILHTEAGGELRVRNHSGVQLGSYRPDGEYISRFSPTLWWDGSEEARFVSVDEGRIFVFNSDGQRIARLAAPALHRLGDVVGVPVRLAGDAAFYASVVQHNLFDRS